MTIITKEQYEELVYKINSWGKVSERSNDYLQYLDYIDKIERYEAMENDRLLSRETDPIDHSRGSIS